jgi:CHAT domain-containing protein
MRLFACGVLFVAVLACGKESGDGGEQTSPGAAASALPAAAESLLASGHVSYKAQDFEAARNQWLAVLSRARTPRDSMLQAELYTWLGLAAYRLGDLDTAKVWETRALEIKSRLARPHQLWRTYNALGLMALDENMNDSAATLFEKAGEVATRAGDAEGVAKATGNAALAYSYLGDLERARAGHRAMRNAGRRLGDPKTEANGLANEAMVDIWEGDATVAILRLDTARSIYRATGDGVGEANALGQLATAFQLIGNFSDAFTALDSALIVTRKHQLATNEIEILRLLGALHARLGDHRRALSFYGEGEKLARTGGADADLASLLRGSAISSFRLGNSRRARSQIAEALRLHREAEEPLEQIDDLLALADFISESGDQAAAAVTLRQAADLAAASDNPAAAGMVTVAEARVADRKAEPSRALQLLERLGDESRIGFDLRSTALSLKSRAFLRLGALDSAIVAGRLAVTEVERVRSDLASSAMRSAWIADRSQIYSDYIIALLRAGRTAEAFAVADRARSRTLLENLGAVRNGLSGAGIPPEMMESERVLRRVDALMEALARTSRPRSDSRGRVVVDPAQPIVARLAAARAEYERLQIRAAQKAQSTAAILNLSAFNLGVVSQTLRSDEALIEFFLGPDSLFVFVVKRDGLRVTRGPANAALLTERLRLLKDLWGTRRKDWSVGLGPSRALHETLLGPARKAGFLNGVRRLVIVPHGMLAQIPYAALQDPRTGRFVIEDYDIGQSPSAAAFAALRGQSTRGDRLERSAALAPFRRELPGSGREVAAIAATDPSVKIWTDGKATEAELRRELARAGIVHVASHGVLNHLNPMFSRVELAGGGREQVDNGRLEVHELLSLSIRNSLVFLSGCETGASEEWSDGPFRSTGDLTLSQAFLSAGARNVASTLWRIDDEGAAVVAGRFYSAVRRAPVFAALSGAQRSLVRDRRFGSPYYWAGYVMSGDGRQLNPPQKIAAASVH